MNRLNLPTAENLEGRIDVARAVGSTATLMFVYDLPPGESSSPYHYEYDEEWLLVVTGDVVLRAPDGEHALGPGDLVFFPPGPAGAHKVTNRSDSPARTLLFSHKRGIGLSVYPDSDTINVYPADEVDELTFRRGDAVPWRYGEDGSEDTSP